MCRFYVYDFLFKADAGSSTRKTFLFCNSKDVENKFTFSELTDPSHKKSNHWKKSREVENSRNNGFNYANKTLPFWGCNIVLHHWVHLTGKCLWDVFNNATSKYFQLLNNIDVSAPSRHPKAYHFSPDFSLFYYTIDVYHRKHYVLFMFQFDLDKIPIT